MQSLLQAAKLTVKEKNFYDRTDVLSLQILPTIILCCSLIIGIMTSTIKTMSCYTSTTFHGMGVEDYITQYCQTADKFAKGNSFSSSIYLGLPLIVFLQSCS